jgi:hypothetical protein
MDALVIYLVAAAWTAILAMLAWGVASSWHRVWSDQDPLPFFGMLQRRGLVLERLERSPEPLYAAVRRCTMCREKARCRDWLERSVGGPPACPNEAFLEAAPRA